MNREAYILFFIKSISIFLLTPYFLYHCLKKIRQENFSEVFLLLFSFGTSPLLNTWIFSALLRFFPGKTDAFYILALSLPSFLLTFFFFQKKKEFWKDVVKTYQFLAPLNIIDKFFFCTIIFCFGCFIIFFLKVPLLANDPLAYLHLSKLFLIKKQVDFYPILNGEMTNGFIAPWTHPIGYPMFLSLNMLGHEGNLGILVAKLSTLYFPLMSCLVMTFASREGRFPYIWMGSFLFLSTPICFETICICHIDVLRMYLFFLAGIVLFLSLKKQNLFGTILLGTTCGMSWFIHSSGILTLFIMVPISYLFSWKKPKETIFFSIIIIGITFLFVGIDLIHIFKKTGNFIEDRGNIKIITSLATEYKRFLKIDREVFNLIDALKNSIGRPLIDISQFCFLYYFFLVSLLFFFKKKLFYFLNIYSFSYFVILIFYSGILLSILLKIDTFAINVRYILSPHLFVCLSNTLFLSYFLKGRKNIYA